jgi:hypothetical protein
MNEILIPSPYAGEGEDSGCLVHWRFGDSNLFGIWNLVLGI